MSRRLWEPQGKMECSRGCPAVGTLYDELTELEGSRDLWRTVALAMILLSAMLILKILTV